MVIRPLGGNMICHPGLPGGEIEEFDEGDYRDLVRTGLLRVTTRTPLEEVFDVSREAYSLYDDAHRNAAEPLEQYEQRPLEVVSSEVFVARYRRAAEKWVEADATLRRDDGTVGLTTVGHLCREAIQLFVTRLAEIHGVTDLEHDQAKTVNRLRSVIDARRGTVSSRKADLLVALVEYWKAMNGLVQRQEHGEQRAAEELTWEDGRRVLLHTAIVMTECDRVLA